MGSHMAGHIAKADYKLRVFNRTAKKAEIWKQEYLGDIASSPSEASQGCDMVFLCLGGDDDVREVIDGKSGILETLESGAIVIDHTTTSASLSREIASKLFEHGIHYIDAPVSGGEIGAKEGQLTIMAGGNQEAFNTCIEVMNCYSKFCKRMGGPGSGQLTKMVNQICIAGLIQALAEGMDFSKKAGLDTKEVIDVISRGAAQSWQMENRWKSMLDDFYEHGFAVDLMRKDLGFVLEEAEKNGSILDITKLVDSFYSEIQNRGGGKWDTSSLFKRLSEK